MEWIQELLDKSQQMLFLWDIKDIQNFLPELIVGFEKLDYEAAKIENDYDLYRIERYEHWKKKKKLGEINRTEKEIEIESKKDALKEFGDKLLWKKVAQHYKLNIDQLSQRKIDLQVENKNMRQSGL